MTDIGRVDFETAMAMSHAAAALGPAETSRVIDALDRVTATAVHAVSDHPMFDCSAMDGYALHRLDLAETRLALGAPMLAGEHAGSLARGTAAAIATGAQVPADCGAVTAREQALEIAGYVTIRDAPVRSGQNVRRRGEDVTAGERVLPPGKKLTAAALGTLVCYGVTEVAVRRRPRVTLFATGDEIAAGALPDANTPMIRALLIQAGAEVTVVPPVADEPAALGQAVRAALDGGADMVVLTGGTSAGDRSRTGPAFAALGANTLFHGVRMRPGKPVLATQLPDGRLLFGLPGNPLAALVAARFFVCQAVRGWLGLSLETGVAVTAPAKNPTATLVLKARSWFDQNARLRVEILSGQQSHRLRSLLDADNWLVVLPDPTVDALLFSLSP